MAKKAVALTGVITLDLTPKSDVPADSERLIRAAEVLEIKDDGGFATASEIVKTCAARIKAHEDTWSAAKNTSHQAHATICATLKKLCGPYAKVREALETKMRAYREAQESAKIQQQAEIQESGTELRDELLTQARDARRLGDIKQAKALEAQAETVIVDVALPDARPDVEGLGERWPWEGWCDKPMELIAAVSEGRVPLLHTIPVRGGGTEEVPILTIDERVLTFYAKALGADIGLKLPGCKAQKRLSFAVSSAKE